MEVYKRHQSEKFRKIGWHSLNSIQKLIHFWHIMIPKGYTEADYLGNPVCDSFRPATEGMVLSIIVDTISQKIYKPASIYYSTYSLR